MEVWKSVSEVLNYFTILPHFSYFHTSILKIHYTQTHIVQSADLRVSDRIGIIFIQQVGGADLDHAVLQFWKFHTDLRIQCTERWCGAGNE